MNNVCELFLFLLGNTIAVLKKADHHGSIVGLDMTKWYQAIPTQLNLLLHFLITHHSQTQINAGWRKSPCHSCLGDHVWQWPINVGNLKPPTPTIMCRLGAALHTWNVTEIQHIFTFDSTCNCLTISFPFHLTLILIFGEFKAAFLFHESHQGVTPVIQCFSVFPCMQFTLPTQCGATYTAASTQSNHNSLYWGGKKLHLMFTTWPV